jgi:hypothetical protein
MLQDCSILAEPVQPVLSADEIDQLLEHLEVTTRSKSQSEPSSDEKIASAIFKLCHHTKLKEKLNIGHEVARKICAVMKTNVRESYLEQISIFLYLMITCFVMFAWFLFVFLFSFSSIYLFIYLFLNRRSGFVRLTQMCPF